MKHLLAIFLAALCATSSAQTIRTLGYNTTNGQIVAATNVTWTNSFCFSTNAVAAQVRTNLSLGWSALTNTNAATSLLGYTTNGQVVANTGTNVLTFTNETRFGGGDIVINVNSAFWSGNGVGINFEEGAFISGDTNSQWRFEMPFYFTSSSLEAQTRTNLGLPLAALTNTSNVTMMRALAGSTNPGVPFSGTIVYLDDNSQPFVLEITNGIIVDNYAQ